MLYLTLDIILDYIPLMRYGIGTLRDNQRERLSLI